MANSLLLLTQLVLIPHLLPPHPLPHRPPPPPPPPRQDPHEEPPRVHHRRLERHRPRHRPPGRRIRRPHLPPRPEPSESRRSANPSELLPASTLPSSALTSATAVAQALDKAGPVDVLVCSQGVLTPRELEEMEIEDVRFMMGVNVMGTFHLIKAALPGMKRRVMETRVPGSIAMVSSQAGQVGLYGYTAYSVSKFALRGLGEALQHEVIANNIRVSLIFPPDTETPGLVEENRVRPELTSLVAGSSTAMKADDVAKKALNGIKSGTFIVSCNFEGFMLSIATAGLSPQSSSLSAFMEVLCAGFMHFLGLCFQWNWYNIIEKHSKKKKY